MIRTEQKPSAPAPAAPALSLVEQMADTMCEMAMSGTAVTAETLFEFSTFTRDEIKAHALEAADLARSRAVRQAA